MKMANFRDLPSIEKVLNSSRIKELISRYGKQRVTNSIRLIQESFRKLQEIPDWAANADMYEEKLEYLLSLNQHKRVFNLTGTVIHTNLGRSPLKKEILRKIEPLLINPVSLEYNLNTGKRGNREAFVAKHLADLCGAEAATLVNNNAAALMLCLNTLALNKDVPVSRGELIEIGGSFRLPSLIEQSGCKLKEVGTTNRTHLSDFRNALSNETPVVLKIHPSNYHIEGFTKQVETKELAELCKDHGSTLCVDLGSSTLVNLERWGLPHEPTPKEVLQQGADLVMFSGDKLMGSVQAGIIVGRQDLIENISSNPMKRALRLDKFALTYLAETLLSYENLDTLKTQVPLINTLTTPHEELKDRAIKLKLKLSSILVGCELSIIESKVQIGSGAMPEKYLQSICVSIGQKNSNEAENLAKKMRALPIPVIGRVRSGELLLDAIGATPISELLLNLDHLT